MTAKPIVALVVAAAVVAGILHFAPEPHRVAPAPAPVVEIEAPKPEIIVPVAPEPKVSVAPPPARPLCVTPAHRQPAKKVMHRAPKATAAEIVITPAQP